MNMKSYNSGLFKIWIKIPRTDVSHSHILVRENIYKYTTLKMQKWLNTVKFKTLAPLKNTFLYKKISQDNIYKEKHPSFLFLHSKLSVLISDFHFWPNMVSLACAFLLSTYSPKHKELRPLIILGGGASLVAQTKESACNAGDPGSIPG